MLPLVCIDVDGTLVGPCGDPTPRVWTAAAEAILRGQHLAICTARGAFGKSWEYAQRLDPDGWHVFHTGAALVHTGTDEVIEQALTPEQIDAIETTALHHGWVLEHYAPRDYTVAQTGRLAEDHAALMGVPFTPRGPETLEGNTVRLQYVVVTDQAASAVASAPPGTTASAATSPIMPGAVFVTVTRDSVSKGTAITQLAEKLNTTAANVMMIGDGHNDVEAMKVAGYPVAMGNADAQCRAVADYVVADVEHDGVAEALALSSRLPSTD